MDSAAQDSAYEWFPPSYDVSKEPSCVYDDKPFSDDKDFIRTAKWCPDGSSALAQCESGHLQFLNLPQDLLEVTLDSAPEVPGTLLMPRARQASPVVDFAWYPTATRRDPASFCFVASVRECPVKLIDASDGRLRASYKIVDHRERQIAPHSLAFNPTSTKLYCGFEDAIEVFEVHYPGEGTRLHTTPSKKSRDGLKGIVSALSFAPDLSSGVYAAGSLNPSSTTSSNIALFSELTGETPLMFVGDEREGGFGIRASVMQVMFNPVKPHLLYASFRRHDTLYCWDVRGDVGVPVQKLMTSTKNSPISSEHSETTNQKLRFDIDLGGKRLSVGDHSGRIFTFDLTSYGDSQQPLVDPFSPVLSYIAHADAVGSVGFHPLKPLLLSVSGSRHFDKYSDHMSEEDPDADQELGDDAPARSHTMAPYATDNTVKLWSF